GRRLGGAVGPWAGGLPGSGVGVIWSFPPWATGPAQPLPNWPTAAALNCSLNLSRPPQSRSIAWAICPLGEPPPCGFIEFQKKVWFQTWAALLNTPVFDVSL